eukprot:524417-Pelagomonas_calceolata.AAC.1
MEKRKPRTEAPCFPLTILVSLEEKGYKGKKGLQGLYQEKQSKKTLGIRRLTSSSQCLISMMRAEKSFVKSAGTSYKSTLDSNQHAFRKDPGLSQQSELKLALSPTN